MSQSSKKIFDNFNSKDDIERLISEKISESLYIEFKQKTNQFKSELDDNDKKNFSEALSQFANSDGGVLIFGIKTEKPNDFAVELKPIKNPEDFLKRLMDYFSYAIQPGIDGVISKIIKHDLDSGYVLFEIPSSYKVPHRSMFSREYLKRNQNGKYKLEHFDLEDMFGRRQKPLLSVEILSAIPEKKKFTLLEEDRTVLNYLGALEYSIFINNEGRYLAKNSMIVLTFPSETYAKCEINAIGGSGVVISEITGLRSGNPTFQITMTNLLFYPNLSTRVLSLKLRINLKEFDNQSSIPIIWEIYAEDMAQKRGQVNLVYRDQIEW